MHLMPVEVVECTCSEPVQVASIYPSASSILLDFMAGYTFLTFEFRRLSVLSTVGGCTWPFYWSNSLRFLDVSWHYIGDYRHDQLVLLYHPVRHVPQQHRFHFCSFVPFGSMLIDYSLKERAFVSLLPRSLFFLAFFLFCESLSQGRNQRGKSHPPPTHTPCIMNPTDFHAYIWIKLAIRNKEIVYSPGI